MPDLDKEQATTEAEPESELAKFAQEFHDAKFQRPAPEEPEPKEPKQTLEETAPVEETAKDETVKETPEPTQPADQEPQVRLYTVPDHEMYGELRGQKVTATQLEEAGLIGKVITRDHQEMHNTKLYQELKKEFDEKLERKLKEFKPPEKPPEQTINPKQFTEMVERQYVPVLKQLAEAGQIEPDFVEAYPLWAAQTAHQIETMRLVGAGVVKAIGEIKEWVGMQQQTTTKDKAMSHLDQAAISVAASEELMRPLSEAGERKAFVAWMSDPKNTQPWKKMDIFTELSQPENLRGAYAAFKVATRGSRETTPAPVQNREKKNLAAPPGGSGRNAPKQPEPSEFDQFKDDLLKARAQSFGR